MGDENPIRTLGDYSKPSHKGYRNTIELPVRNNVVPLRSETIQLVQNGSSFHELRSEDPNQHLKDFLKLVDSLDLDGILHTTLCEIDRAAGGKLCIKNTDESWEIIENLALYDHEGWDETNEFVKPVKAIAIPHGILKTPDRRLLELEDQISFSLKGSRPTPTSSLAHTPQAFVKAAHSNSRPQNQNEPPTLNIFDFHERIEPVPTETPENVLIREEAKFPVTKNVNSISLAKEEDEREEVETKDEAENRPGNKSIKTPESEEVVEAPDSQPVAYYLKHKINEKLIKGLVNNNRFNNSLSGTRFGKKKKKAYNVLPGGPVYEAILKKKITKKEDIRGNFEIPCSIGGLKHVNALVDQGSDVNVMPYSTYMKLTDERPAETDIRLSLASHSYIYPLGIAEDVLVEVAEHIYPADFVIMDIKENEKRPFILGMPFLTTAKASIKFDTCTITLRSGKSKISFYRIPEPLFHVKKGIKNDIEPIAPTMTVNRLVLEWEERIRLHQEKEMEFNQWRSKNFKDEHPSLTEEEGVEDEGEVT
ncbi:MAK10-like protein [Tanacetum coccineum]